MRFEDDLQVLADALWSDQHLRLSFYCIWVEDFAHGAVSERQYADFGLVFDRFLVAHLPVIDIPDEGWALGTYARTGCACYFDRAGRRWGGRWDGRSCLGFFDVLSAGRVHQCETSPDAVPPRPGRRLAHP